MSFSLFLDVVVAALLVVTISYAVVLNRRLQAMRSDRAELGRLAGTFQQATSRADESVGRMKQTAESLQQRLEKAQAVREDLTFLVDRAAAQADRLEEAVRAARGASDAASVAAEMVPAARASAPRPVEARGRAVQPRSDTERALLKAIRAAG